MSDIRDSIINIKVDINNKTMKPDFTRTGYISWEDDRYFKGKTYNLYRCLADIEDDFGNGSYVYRLSKDIFSNNCNVDGIIIGYVDGIIISYI